MRQRRPTLFCTRYCTIQLEVKSWVVEEMSSLLSTLPMTWLSDEAEQAALASGKDAVTPWLRSLNRLRCWAWPDGAGWWRSGHQ